MVSNITNIKQHQWLCNLLDRRIFNKILQKIKQNNTTVSLTFIYPLQTIIQHYTWAVPKH